jgi:prevent-host-death family protein
LNWRVHFVAKDDKNTGIVISALHARTHFGNLLRRVEDERQSVVIEKRGTPRAVLLSLRDYVRLAAPESEILRIIGAESEARGTDKLNGRQIDKVIRETRAKRSKRK